MADDDTSHRFVPRPAENADSDTNSLDLETRKLLEFRRDGTRFRVLILGRTNAGKTTILERLCGNSADDAKVYRDGKIVVRERLLQRGFLVSLKRR
jgi:septin family protein